MTNQSEGIAAVTRFDWSIQALQSDSVRELGSEILSELRPIKTALLSSIFQPDWSASLQRFQGRLATLPTNTAVVFKTKPLTVNSYFIIHHHRFDLIRNDHTMCDYNYRYAPVLLVEHFITVLVLWRSNSYRYTTVNIGFSKVFESIASRGNVMIQPVKYYKIGARTL